MAVVALLLGVGAGAQSAPTQIVLGRSIAALSGPWRFTPGDAPAYAGAGFDDAGWARMDLSPDANEVDPGYGTPGYVPGWTSKGYPGLAGFAWYRLRLHLAAGAPGLALKMPDHVDDAYQVFANGKLLGSFGDFTGTKVVCYRARPEVFALPAPDANGNLVLAIRFYEEPWVAYQATSPQSGGMHETPLVGLPDEVAYLRQQEVNARLMALLPSVFVGLLLLIVAAGAFWIWLLDRPQVTYLWLTLALIVTSLMPFVRLITLFTFYWSQDTEGFFLGAETYGLLLCWVMFWQTWFGLRMLRSVRLVLIVAGLLVIPVDAYVFRAANTASTSLNLHLFQLVALAELVMGVLLFVNLYRGARKDRTGALLAVVPVFLGGFSVFTQELLNWAHVRTTFFPFGLQVGVVDLSSVLLVLVIGALVARRFIGSQVSQKMARQTIDQELEQARELQQHVLIPEPIDSALFRVESEYKPARSVGGDFFQVMTHADGSLLVVVGDVSGKGMAAAMLVAVLVGAIRTCADHTFSPAAILGTLNERLLGRAGGHFATCVALHLHADGTVLMANAGHIPPFVDGVAVEVAGSVPLGILPEAEYEVHPLKLAPLQRLTLVTDGVLEARNAAGELLGFERLAELSALAPGAIAQAAVAHGQDDDITVVSVTLLGVEPGKATAESYVSA